MDSVIQKSTSKIVWPRLYSRIYYPGLASFLNKYLKNRSHANQNFLSKYFLSSIKQNNYQLVFFTFLGTGGVQQVAEVGRGGAVFKLGSLSSNAHWLGVPDREIT